MLKEMEDVVINLRRLHHTSRIVIGSDLNVACVVRGGYHLNSDRWPIDASLRLERKELWCTVNHDEFSQRGWAPKTDEAKQIFMRRDAQDLCWTNDEAKGKALVSVEEIINSMQLGSTLTIQPYDSGVDFRSTGHALHSPGLH